MQFYQYQYLNLVEAGRDLCANTRLRLTLWRDPQLLPWGVWSSSDMFCNHLASLMCDARVSCVPRV